MTRSVYKKLPSKNQKLNKNQKEKFVEPTKQQTSTSKTNTKAKTKCVTKKNQKGKFQKKINKQTEKQPQNKDLFRKLLQTKVDFKNIQKEMLHRKIQQNDNILKNKPYFNYFHCKNYEKDSRKCDNCFDSLTSDENEMLHCESCNSYIHKLCYSVSQDQFDIINFCSFAIQVQNLQINNLKFYYDFVQLKVQETEDEYNFSFIKCESCLEREINPEIDLQCIICQRDIGIMKCFFFDSRKVQYSSKKNQQYSDYEYCVDKTPVILLNEEQVKKNKFIKRVFVHPLCVNSSSCLFIYQFKLLLIWDEEDYKKKSNQGKKNKCQQCLKGNGLLIQVNQNTFKYY